MATLKLALKTTAWIVGLTLAIYFLGPLIGLDDLLLNIASKIIMFFVFFF